MNQSIVGTPSPAVMKSICWLREDTARKINATFDRLTLVVEVLQETHGGDVIPGTRGLRQGAEAALQEMLSHLTRLPREDVATENFLIGPEEEHSTTWISDLSNRQTLPNGTLVFIQQIIKRLLP